ncbi:MAG TPA: hypothetical protein VG944_09940 [Fimbriimonas sp.]|nr:hypothetical protein [Fimbriimonas sp.]
MRINIAIALGVCLLSLSLAFPDVQGVNARARKGGPHLKGELVPLFRLEKSAPFPVAELPSNLFNFSRAEIITVPAGFFGNKKAQMIAYLTFGAKRGGLVRLYETVPIPTTPPAKLAKAIAAKGIFKDSYRDPHYVTGGVSAKKVEIVVTSLDKNLLNQALQWLRKNA